MDPFLNHFLDDTSELIIRGVNDFCRRFLTDEIIKTIEESDEIPKSLSEAAREMNLYGIRIPQKYGGSELDLLTSLIIHETMASYSLTAAVYLDQTLFAEPVIKYGTEKQKMKYLKEVVDRGVTTTSAMTEPGAGSDVMGIKTKAVRENGKWILNGNKIFITMGDQAEFFLVFAKTGEERDKNSMTAFLVRGDNPGLSIGRKIDKIGQRGTHINELSFNNMAIEDEDVLGSVGQGYEIAMYSYNYGRVFVSAEALGLAEGALRKSAEFSEQRVAFGQKISRFQMIKDHLAQMEIMIETARSLLYRTASYENTNEFTRFSSIAKYYCTEISSETAKRAVKIHGGMGVTTDGGIERLLRDAVIQEIYEGTNEIQKLVISREVSRKYG